MATNVVEIKDMKTMLDYKITHWNKQNGRNKKTEALFCDMLEEHLPKYLNDLGYKHISSAREFKMPNGRPDFLVKLENDKYLIIEVKHSNDKSNDDLTYSFAVGQLLTYKSNMHIWYDIPLNNIELMLITDTDSVMALNTIKNNKLNIKYTVFGKGVAKYYG